MDMAAVSEVSIRGVVSKSVERALCKLHSASAAAKATALRETIASSIVFPNKANQKSCNKDTATAALEGKPYNVELRIALKLYHQWKRDQDKACNHEERETKQISIPSEEGHKCTAVTITSDLGLSREVLSPLQLAELVAPLLEADLRDNPQWGLVPDVRCQTSGVMSLITVARFQELRSSKNMLPCPHCIKWCKGEKGLWWHQQLYHRQEHAEAAALAKATGNNECAMVVYNQDNTATGLLGSIASSTSKNSTTASPIHQTTSCDDPFDCIRNGNLECLQRIVNADKFQPSTAYDRKGATPLMWAAGCGHVEMVKFLVEQCQCDPRQAQKGKRSFAGRTALHWAARNGRLGVVQYIVSTAQTGASKRELMEAATQDGTTAFGWACWQRHLDVMEFLSQQGCDIDSVNSYGCSPVLWCSQGVNGDGLKALQWLQLRGCCMKRVNSNGHGVLHKAAQRGQQDVVEWFIKQILNESNEMEGTIELIGPDTEGYCPSDLAGMEGHSDLAMLLAETEMKVCRDLRLAPDYAIPDEFGTLYDMDNKARENWTWEKYGGLRRMNASLHGDANL